VIVPLVVQVYTRFLYPVPVNGDSWFQLPATVVDVGTKLFAELSVMYAPDIVFNNKLVPETAVNGVVLGVKVLV